MNLIARTYLRYISILRIYIGYYPARQGLRTYQRQFPNGDWIGGQTGDVANLDLYPWYKTFWLERVCAPPRTVQISVHVRRARGGTCLLLGLLTRFSSNVGLLMLINCYPGPGMARGGAPLAQQQTVIVALAIFMLSNPGRTLGLDGLLFSGGKGEGTR